MTDYLLLYSGGKMPETEAEQADVMKAWDVWMTSIGPALKDRAVLGQLHRVVEGARLDDRVPARR